MAQTKTKVRRTKMRAVQKLFYDQRIVKEDEVFIWKGDELPSRDVAVPVAKDTPVGVQRADESNSKDAPGWTTKGFVDQANRGRGLEDEDSDD